METDKEIWIFLSHSNKDFAKVRKIRNYLEEHSCRPLMFYLKCLSNDDEINDLIKREIDCRTRFIICDSENSRASHWVQSEVDYIKSQNRDYTIIDLTQDEDSITDQLNSIVKGTYVFLSYKRKDIEFVDAVYSHIFKYDIISVTNDNIYDFISASNFSEMVRRKITKAKDCGFIILFASEASLNSKFVNSEILCARELGAKILIICMDKTAKYNKELFYYLYHDISDANSFDEKVELAIEAIVNFAFNYSAVYTMANNFLKGIDCPIDDDEANRLFGIAYRAAIKADSNGDSNGKLIIARCKSNGYGTEKDLQCALHYYQQYVNACGSNSTIDQEIDALKLKFISLI